MKRIGKHHHGNPNKPCPGGKRCPLNTVALTAKEFEALKAIDESEYGDDLLDSVWSFTIVDNSTLNTRSVGGVVASLVKKGFVKCDTGSGDDEASVGMTHAGAKAYIARNGGSKKHYEPELGETAEAIALAAEMPSPFDLAGAFLEGRKPPKRSGSVQAAMDRVNAVLVDINKEDS